jgi:hypothetical protein
MEKRGSGKQLAQKYKRIEGNVFTSPKVFHREEKTLWKY